MLARPQAASGWALFAGGGSLLMWPQVPLFSVSEGQG